MQHTMERPRQADNTKERATTALIGAAAGAVGTVVLDKVDWFLWDHEDPTAKHRTEAVRPGGEPPADVLVGRVEDAPTRTRSAASLHIMRSASLRRSPMPCSATGCRSMDRRAARFMGSGCG